jgi:hypothetical protein
MIDPPVLKSAPSVFQHRLSLVLLGILVLIAGAVIWIQTQYDPLAWREQSKNQIQPPEIEKEAVEGVVPISPIEKYNAENLSDKINGKADLYLSAGFRSLESRRFGMTADKARWMERYVYDMGGRRNAFSVFSAQRRQDAEQMALASHAYLSANGLFLVHGPFYVEIIGTEASGPMQSLMKALGTAFVRSRSVSSGKLQELSLFPSDYHVPHTTQLIADSAFGIQVLDWVYTSNYADGEARATAFVSNRKTAEQALTAMEAFIGYWKEFGGETVQAPDHLPDQVKDARIVLILDNYEIAMVQGEYLFGVHEATDLEFGLVLAAALQQSIEGPANDR